MQSTSISTIKSQAREHVLKSEAFLKFLAKIAEKISLDAKEAKSEADVVYSFDSHYISIIKEALDLDFKPSKEESVDTVKLSVSGRKNKKGRIDSRIGSVVIEFKHPSKFKTEMQIKNAITQTYEYLHGLNKANSGSYYGLVTDGIKSITLRLEDGIEFKSAIVDLGASELQKLACAISLLNKKELSPHNLVEDFCSSDSSISSRLTSALLNALDTHMTGRSKMLFMEWQELFRLAHDDKSKQRAIQERRQSLEQIAGYKLSDNESEYKVLYSVQTAYAIVVKIIAYKVISLNFGNETDRFNEMQRYDSSSIRQHMSDLEDGAVFRDYGIGNLLEGDFFSWYCTDDQWDDHIYQEISSIFSLLSEYEDRTLLKEGKKVYDFFKDLYMNFIPEKVRHSLGEFYTPPWLAEHLISNAIRHLDNDDTWTALDPCCGSGTFITVLIDRALNKKHSSDSEKLNYIINSIKGIDLNPLAVLTARINYFINISDLIKDTQNIEIPIYLGDSSYVPEKEKINGVHCLKYTINTLKGPLEVKIPESAVQDPNIFSRTMSNIEYSIKDLDYLGVYEQLISLCDPVDLNDEIVNNISILSRKFIELESQEWNGIWARIVTNFLTTANIGKFDLIVGNPPWIDWKNLPAGYRERVKSLCVSRNLFSGDSVTGGINLNICALISNVAADNWLSKKGVLSFLMPHNLIFQQTYEGFRNFETTSGRLYLQEIYDWSKSGHPFKPVTVKFSTYIYSSKKVDYSLGIPANFVRKKGGTPALSNFQTNSKYRDVEEVFSISSELAGTIHDENNAFSYAVDSNQLASYRAIAGGSSYKGREGVEFFPQEFFLMNYVGEVGDILKFVNYQGGTRSKYKLSKQTVLFEKKYVHPLVKGNDIEPFKVKPTSYYVPFPYEENSIKAIEIHDLNKKSPLMAKYFRRNKDILEKQTDYNDKIIGKKNLSAFYSLARVGLYTYGEHFVCFRDNTKWQAAVVSAMDTPWGEKKRPLFQNHAVSISQREDGSFISFDEAHFICAIMNAPSTKSYIENSSDSRSFKIRPPVHIPVFDNSNDSHKKLSLLSKEAHEARFCNNSINHILESIENLILKGI